MKGYLFLLFLAVSLPLAISQDDDTDKNVDAGNATLGREDEEIVVKDAENDVEDSFGFLTIQQSYVAPENAPGDDQGLLSVAQLANHAKLMEALAQVNVEKFGVNWTLADFCFKLHPHKPDEKAAEKMFKVLERGFPCNVVSPLDCFVEGGFVHSPKPYLDMGKRLAQLGLVSYGELDWASFDPQNFWIVLEIFAGRSGNYEVQASVRKLLEIFEKIRITHGYAQKFCLDLENPRCPANAHNKANSTAEIDVRSFLGDGCSGIIESIEYWEPNLFLGGLTQNSPGEPIESADFMATTILLANASTVYSKIADHPGIKRGLNELDWTQEGIAGAAALMSEWYNKSTEVLQKLTETNDFAGVKLDFTPTREWIDATKIHAKLVKSATNGNAGWESVFGDYSKFQWLFTDEE